MTSPMMKNKYAIMIFGTLFVVAADQVSKIAVIAHFRDKQTVSLIDNLLALTYVGNDGAAFGLFSGKSLYFFLTISALAIGFILYFFWTLERDRAILASALALILGGALGNQVDRVRLGFVIDFIDVHHNFTVLPVNFTWPKFNVADVAILVGVGLFLYDMIKMERQRLQEREQEA